MMITLETYLHFAQHPLCLSHVFKILLDLLLPGQQLSLQVTHLHFCVYSKEKEKQGLTRASSSMVGEAGQFICPCLRVMESTATAMMALPLRAPLVGTLVLVLLLILPSMPLVLLLQLVNRSLCVQNQLFTYICFSLLNFSTTKSFTILFFLFGKS